MPLSHCLLALVVTTLWGLSFVVIKLGVGTTPPLLLGALRFAFAAFPAVFFVPRPRTRLSLILGYGFFLGVVQFGLLFSAVSLGMPASLASVVMQAQVFFTILFAVALGERPGPDQVLGAVIACLGLVLIAWPRMSGGGAGPFLMTVAAAAAWASPTSWASVRAASTCWASSSGRASWRRCRSSASPSSSRGRSAFSPPSPGPASASWGSSRISPIRPRSSPSGSGADLLSRHPAAVVTPFALLVPVAGILGSTLILGERMVPMEVAGGVVILAGLSVNIFGSRLLRIVRPAGPRLP